MQRTVLVVGTRPGSLGEAIYLSLKAQGIDAIRADRPMEGLDSAVYRCDVLDRTDTRKMLRVLRPTDVVCCVGINLPDDPMLLPALSGQFQVNTYGPVQLLMEALEYWDDEPGVHIDVPTGANFVAISSNSAHIARSQSTGYCASKAALSMALRCIARNHGGRDGYCIWGYEPGWINGTPMSDDVMDRLGEYGRTHRIPGGDGLDKWVLADKIAHDLIYAQHGFNGCMFRIDGGEQ
jgi:NAD(P)-dependent dehydrogenase (short-subunit alcohol dehydrogenase family)